MIAIFIKYAAVLIALGLSALATGVAYTFGLAQSPAELCGVPLWGAAAGLAAAALPTLPFLSRNAWASRRYGALAAAATLAVLFVGFTLTGSFGFGATARSGTAALAQSAIDGRRDAKAEVDRLVAAIAKTPAHGSVDAIRLRIKTLQRSPKTNATAIVTAATELGVAEREIDLQRQLAVARERMPPAPKTLVADPQAEGLANLASAVLGKVTTDEIRTGVSGWLALLLDLGAGLLLFAASAPIATGGAPSNGSKRRWSATEWFADLEKRIKTQVEKPIEKQSAAQIKNTDEGGPALTVSDPVIAGGADEMPPLPSSVSADVISIPASDPRITAETVVRFVSKRCVTGADLEAPTADLARAYAELHGLENVSTVLLGRALAEAGYKRTEIRANGKIRRGWAGLSPKPRIESAAS